MRSRDFSISATAVALAWGCWGGFHTTPPAAAQTVECAPPQAGEYLLLVISESPDDPNTIRGFLTPQLTAQTCTYLDETVVRVSGFSNQEQASGLARLITQESGLAAFVTRPPTDAPPPPADPPVSTSPQPPTPGLLDLPTVEVIEARPAGAPPPRQAESDRNTSDASDDEDLADIDIDLDIDAEDLPPADLPTGSFDVPPPDTNPDDLPVYVPAPGSNPSIPTVPTTPLPGTVGAIPGMPTAPSPSLAYNPQPLAEGYAVLVDYFNQPQVAGQLQQLTNNPVGLVSYGQRPYLLVGYSRTEAEANALLQQLSSSGFWTMVVDSQRVMLLTPQVQMN